MKIYWLILMFIAGLLTGQFKSAEKPEDLIYYLGISGNSPDLFQLMQDLDLEIKQRGNSANYLSNGGITVNFNSEELTGGGNLLVEEIHLEMRDEFPNTFMEPGIFGIKQGMTRKQVEKILKELKNSHKHTKGDEFTYSHYNPDDGFSYDLDFTFIGESKKSKIFSIDLTLPASSLVDKFYKDFDQHGPRTLIPSEVYGYYAGYMDSLHVYLHAIPDNTCRDCLITKKYSTITLPNGSVYEGAFNYLLAREGKLTFQIDGNQVIYEGEFLYGVAHGDGRISYADGRSYEGQWKWGLLRYIYDFQYDGGMYTGQMNARYQPDRSGGTLTFDDQVITGPFVKGHPQKDYPMEVTYTNGNKYVGGLNSNYKPDGPGKLEWTDGQYVEGEFMHDVFMSGIGKIIYDDGSTYLGGMNSSMLPHGEGTHTYADGNTLSGTFEQGYYTGGKTTIDYDDGGSYTGMVNETQELHGFGKLTLPDGDWVEGNFANGKFLGGKGIVRFDDGGYYMGEITADRLPEGSGTYYFSAGGSAETETINGKVAACSGTITLSDGSVYTGEFGPDLVIHGYGKVVGKDITFEGTFADGKFTGGKGRIDYSDGPVYEGGLNSDQKPHGSGIYSFIEYVHSISGYFSNGNISAGHAIIKFPDEGVYEGWVDLNGNPDGQGTLSYDKRANLFTNNDNYIYIKGVFKGEKIIGHASYLNYGKYWEGPMDDELQPHGSGQCKDSMNSRWYSCRYEHGVKQ